jgi:hypothetical protein
MFGFLPLLGSEALSETPPEPISFLPWGGDVIQ